MEEKWEGEGSNKRNLFIIMGLVIAIVAVAGVVIFWPHGGGDEGGSGPVGFAVYDDAGIPAGADIYTWDAYRNGHGGTGEATFNGDYTGEIPPEGGKCFLTTSNNGNTYAGWGVFLLAGTSDLSGYSQLKFWVKTSANLKVGVQDTGEHGVKKEVYISSYGWDGANTWQEITIPKSAFSSVDFSQIWSPFMITVESADKTFYVDQVRWV